MQRLTNSVVCQCIFLLLWQSTGTAARRLQQLPQGVDVALQQASADAAETAAAAVAALPASCAGGCPLGTPAFVCGADGITYMTACLATCSGNTQVAYQGPCLPGGASASSTGPRSTAGPTLARPSPANLARRHPIASLMGAPAAASNATGLAAQAAGPTRVVATAADLLKYAAEGFVLVGMVRQDDPTAAAAPAQAGPRKPTSSPDTELRKQAEATNAQVEVFEMRLDANTGLLYASTDITRGGARDIAYAAAAESEPSWAGRRVRASLRQPPQADAVLPTVGTVVTQATWSPIKAKPAFPYSAVGFLQLYRGSTYFGTCTAAAFGPRVVVTAAHCLYNRGTKTFTTGGVYSPGSYVDASGKQVKPYSSYNIKSFNFQVAWQNETNAKAWWYDIGVGTLNIVGGAALNTGYMGYAFAGSNASTPTLSTGGYPGSTGNLVVSSTQCDVYDNSGNDGVLNYRSASNPGCPRTRCPIAAAGQSGQPAWTSTSGSYQIRGVLSYGPTDTTTCFDWDVYTEVNKVNFDFLKANRNNM